MKVNPTTLPRTSIGHALAWLAGAGGAFAAVVVLAGDAAVTKDLHVSQVPMLIVESESQFAGDEVDFDFIDAAVYQAAAATLEVNATVDRGDGGTYAAGESVRLSVEVSEDAYVWVYDTGTSGNVHRIFPNSFDKDNFVRADAPVFIPSAGADYEFKVSHPRGRELLTVIATKDASPLVDHLVDPARSGMPFAALGMAASVAKDISISLRDDHKVWARDVAFIQID